MCLERHYNRSAGALQEERGSLDEEGREREALYARAEAVSAALSSMGQQLREAIAHVNAGAAASLGAANQPLVKLVLSISSDRGDVGSPRK